MKEPKRLFCIEFDNIYWASMSLVAVVAFVFLMYILPSKPSNSTPSQQAYNARQSITWLYTDKGIPYHYDCIEGVKYLGTRSTHNKIQFAYTGEACKYKGDVQ